MGSGLHGPLGVRVLSHVATDKSYDRELAPRQPQPMVDNSVQEAVLKPTSVRLTSIVQDMGSGLFGPLGVRVLSHVATDKFYDRELAPRQPQHTVDNSVQEAVLKPTSAQVQVVLYL